MLRTDAASIALVSYGKEALTNTLRETTDLYRLQLKENPNPAHLDRTTIGLTIVSDSIARLAEMHDIKLKPVFNLTGTVLHTNLGRAPMPAEAIEAITKVAKGASNLEYDLDRGKRGDRDQHVEAWVCRLTGAEAATVVNNNAAAVLLVLNTLAQRKEVLVSRGELIEIGGSFRIPDVMKRAGAKLHEVGTTNRTHAKDFQEALSEKAALIMKVHTSNYRVQGFTAEVAEAELAKIAQNAQIPFVNDLGSGTLVDLTKYGLPHEPTVTETLKAGADIVTFSGDKLLGGPQAGIIAGRKELIKKIKANPMKRALRVDKLTLAALEAVLKLYHDPDSLARKLPALRLLTRTEDEIALLVEKTIAAIRHFVGDDYRVETSACLSQIGSGAQPVELLPSRAITITTTEKQKKGKLTQKLSEKFRQLPIPVVGRIDDGHLIFDLRCLEDEQNFIEQLYQRDSIEDRK